MLIKVSLTQAAAEFIAETTKNCELLNLLPAILCAEPTYKETYIHNNGTTTIKFDKYSDDYWCLGWYEWDEKYESYIYSDRGIKFLFFINRENVEAVSALVDYKSERFSVLFE